MNKIIKKAWALIGVEAEENGMGEISYKLKNTYINTNTEFIIELVYLFSLIIINSLMLYLMTIMPCVFTILGFAMTLFASIASMPITFNILNGYWCSHKKIW